MKDHEYKSPFVRRVAFYCQKVLPLVFDNSLSYYEALAHFAHKLNETIDGLNKQSMQIMEFEKELGLALDTFENELRQAQTDFETRIETEWSNFRADISHWQTELEGDWEVMKSELQTVEQLIQQKQLELEADYTQYKADLTAQQTAFETAQAGRQQTFETAQTTRQQNFENAQTTRQTNFENAQTARQDAFEEEISTQIEDVTHVRQLSYMGAYSGIMTDPDTIPSIASSPLDIGGMIVRVYHKSYLEDSFKFIKRMTYANIENDSDIPKWYDRDDSYAVVFENPIVNEWIKAGITIFNHDSVFFFQHTPRLVIRKFNTINNEQLALNDSVLQATYTWPGTAQQQGEVLQLRQVEAPMTATPPYYYTTFIFYNGMGLHIDLINQPANSTTKLFPGYTYDAYRGGVLRDPLVSQIHDYSIPRIMKADDDINSYIISDDLSENPGVVRWLCPSLTVRNSLVNLPSDFPNYPDFEIKFEQFKTGGGIGMQTITGGSSSSMYLAKRFYKSNTFSVWYKVTLQQLT